MKNKNLNPIIRIVVFALVGIIAGMGIYRFNANTVAGDRLPMPFGIGTSVVLSGSMEPELSVNDLIIIKKTDELFVGQVIVYQDGGSLTVHRIKTINGDEIITQGDANTAADDPITRDMVKGEVVFALPFAGIVVDFVQTPIVTIFFLAAAVFLMERSFRQEKNSKKDELEAIKEEIEKLKHGGE